MTEHIIIGGDWNAHHPAWLDHNIDDVNECTLDFIVSNELNILSIHCHLTKYVVEAVEATIGIKTIWKGQQAMVENLMHEGNTRNLFTQFNALNTNKIHYSSISEQGDKFNEILSSLDFDCIVIFCDGSTFPNPGIGDAGLVIHNGWSWNIQSMVLQQTLDQISKQ
ncbi:hypothetical protein RFI_01529 [Reticulomyxa filosa]|uniref:Endonuclease/exonuclease/phosphatase domain-containing protein n=1 Tax=Reticulomyxa filosa TaxID=46433 RepID=X6PBU9_RETFI|nr:hypothetical protein RFI_01529 [Reticulomyxa filosa]|eukprot:ETO35534.1 hypothetical protein RFI_01529 [Reticulomyxa filosa]